MERDELAAWLRLTLSEGIGNVAARKLMGAFGLPQTVFDQPASALRQVLSPAQLEALIQPPPDLPALLELTWTWLQQREADDVQHRIAPLGDPLYPQTLLQLDDPPLLLYMLGCAHYSNECPAPQGSTVVIDSQVSLAIVGSRNPTPQGAANARQFAKSLAQAGMTVVSGMALGVDGAAHEGALDAGGTTVAVVGTGLDRVYPRAHHQLAHRIARQGMLISEYPLGTPPLTANFPRRNRLIAGLANGTLVVEAALRSGSLITARQSAEQGKEVFAIPGSIHAAQSRGCHALIKQGAKLVESAQDILEELKSGLSVPISACDDNEVSGPLAPSPVQQTLLSAMGFDAVGLDALQTRTGMSTATLQAELMTLEVDGWITRMPGGLFQRSGG